MRKNTNQTKPNRTQAWLVSCSDCYRDRSPSNEANQNQPWDFVGKPRERDVTAELPQMETWSFSSRTIWGSRDTGRPQWRPLGFFFALDTTAILFTSLSSEVLRNISKLSKLSNYNEFAYCKGLQVYKLTQKMNLKVLWLVMGIGIHACNCST